MEKIAHMSTFLFLNKTYQYTTVFKKNHLKHKLWNSNFISPYEKYEFSLPKRFIPKKNISDSQNVFLVIRISLLLPFRKWHDHSFGCTEILFTPDCYVPRLIDIDQVVAEKLAVYLTLYSRTSVLLFVYVSKNMLYQKDVL